MKKRGVVGKVFGKAKSKEPERMAKIVEIIWEGDKERYNVKEKEVLDMALEVMKSVLGADLASVKV